MGYGIGDLQFLFSAEQLGFAGKEICTLGRLTSYSRQPDIDRVLKQFGKPPIKLPSSLALYSAEDLLEPLGYTVKSLDVSPYEGATIIHDLNKPIPDELDRFPP